jgi:hypothetical protein
MKRLPARALPVRHRLRLRQVPGGHARRPATLSLLRRRVYPPIAWQTKIHLFKYTSQTDLVLKSIFYYEIIAYLSKRREKDNVSKLRSPKDQML